MAASIAGITAQKLRYIEYLLLETWTVAFPGTGDTDGAARLMVPNPVTFVAQKLLMHDQRKPRNKAQDVLYVHDTLEMFGGSLDELATLWCSIRGALVAEHARRVESMGRDLFAHVTEAIREAARIPSDRELSPERIRDACQYGLEEIPGTARPTDSR